MDHKTRQSLHSQVETDEDELKSSKKKKTSSMSIKKNQPLKSEKGRSATDVKKKMSDILSKSNSADGFIPLQFNKSRRNSLVQKSSSLMQGKSLDSDGSMKLNMHPSTKSQALSLPTGASRIMPRQNKT
jgi:hypothetical protein